MTTPQRKKWETLKGDEKVAWIEFKREQKKMFGEDPDLTSYTNHLVARRNRIKKHTNAILKLRAL